MSATFADYSKISDCLYNNFHNSILDFNTIDSLGRRRVKAFHQWEQSKGKGPVDSKMTHSEDCDSYFILLLANCRDKSLWANHVNSETKLFLHRLENRKTFIYDCKEESDMLSKLNEVLRSNDKDSIGHKAYSYFKADKVYSVPFLSLAHIINNHNTDPKARYIIDQGILYLPQSKLTDIIVDEYRKELYSRLEILHSAWEEFPAHIRTVLCAITQQEVQQDVHLATTVCIYLPNHPRPPYTSFPPLCHILRSHCFVLFCFATYMLSPYSFVLPFSPHVPSPHLLSFIFLLFRLAYC